MSRQFPIRVEGLNSPLASPMGGVQLFETLPPLALYVHVPWCVRKCPYCDFNSHALDGELPEAEYLQALRLDLEQALPQIWGRKIVSVFIGGGTPSLLSEAGLDSMLAMLRAYLPLLPEAEITLEANPGTTEAARLRSYVASGVTRLSLGIQSFDDRCLQALGRVHNAAQAKAAVEMALAATARVNLDLMTGLPGQDMAGLESDLRQALAFGTEHLSCYDLTMEPNTVFAKYPPAGLPDDDVAADMQELTHAMLAEAGYERYEVSAYARAGGQCQHNLNYWTFGDYLGIGPGAHSKISMPDRIVREARVRQPASWMERVAAADGSHLAERRELSADDLPFEFMLNVLRLRNGVPTATFTQRTGMSLTAIQEPLSQALARGLMDPDPGKIAPTPLGWRFLNDLQTLFL